MRETWETNKTGLAATLVVEGFQLLDLCWKPAPRLPGGYACHFIFAWQPSINVAEEAYYEGSMRVEPNQYNTVYTELKHRMKVSRMEQISQAAAG